MHRAHASEFPNDNPLLHRGAVWVCAEPCGPLEATPPESDDAERENDREETEPVSEPRPALASTRPDDAFTAFVDTLAAVASEQGDAQAAAAVRELLLRGALEAAAGDERIARALIGAGLMERAHDGLYATASLTALTRAWREVLLGTGDLAACGETTLNEWAAEIVAGALGMPQRAQSLQYELRRRGVAAFGLLRAA